MSPERLKNPAIFKAKAKVYVSPSGASKEIPEISSKNLHVVSGLALLGYVALHGLDARIEPWY